MVGVHDLYIVFKAADLRIDRLTFQKATSGGTPAPQPIATPGPSPSTEPEATEYAWPIAQIRATAAAVLELVSSIKRMLMTIVGDGFVISMVNPSSSHE